MEEEEYAFFLVGVAVRGWGTVDFLVLGGFQLREAGEIKARGVPRREGGVVHNRIAVFSKLVSEAGPAQEVVGVVVMVHVEDQAPANKVSFEGRGLWAAIGVGLGLLAIGHGVHTPELEVAQRHGAEVSFGNILKGWVFVLVLWRVEPLDVELDRGILLPHIRVSSAFIFLNRAAKVPGLAESALKALLQQVNGLWLGCIVQSKEQGVVIIRLDG